MRGRAVTAALGCALLAGACGPIHFGLDGEEGNGSFSTGAMCFPLLEPCDWLRRVMLGGTTRVEGTVLDCEPSYSFPEVDSSAPLTSLGVSGGALRIVGTPVEHECSASADIEAVEVGEASLILKVGRDEVDRLAMWVTEPATMTLARRSYLPNDPLEERTILVQAGTTVELDAIVRDADGEPLLGDRVRWVSTSDEVSFLDWEDFTALSTGDGVTAPMSEIEAEEPMAFARSAGSAIVEARAGEASAQIEIRAVPANEWAASGLCEARAERCNGADDDCDGAVDEGGAATCGITDDEVACDAGRCRVVACAPDRADCDGRGSNGCEIPVRTTRDHCGGCDIACASSEACVDGSCIPFAPMLPGP